VSQYLVYTSRWWKKGWELHVKGVGVTQIKSWDLEEATVLVRDLLQVLDCPDWDTAEIHFIHQGIGW